MLDFLQTNWLTIAGLLLGGLTSWFITWVYFRKGERTKSLTYTTSDVAVVWPENPKEDEALRITYHGRKVPRVTSTTIAIWNSGTDTIDGDDILPEEPLTLKIAEGSQILRVQVLERTRDIIIGDIPGIGSHKAVVRFRYLDAKDGAAFEVLHTGGLDALSVIGTIKGIPEGVRPLDRDNLDRWITRLFRFVLAPVVLLSLLPMLAQPVVAAYHSLGKPWPNSLISVLAWLAIYPLLGLGLKLSWKMDADTGPHRISGVPDKLAAKLGRRIVLMGLRHLPDNRLGKLKTTTTHPSERLLEE